jgi:PAS domain S-box-containing protein
MTSSQKPAPIAGPDLFAALFKTAPDAMVVADREGRIVLANPQAERLFGYAEGDLDGQPIEVLLPESVRTAHVSHRSNYMANPRVRPMGAGYELTGVRRNGQPFPVEIGLSPIGTESGVLFAASIRDISETHRVRQALTRARHDTFAAQIGRLALEAPNYEVAVDSMPSLVASALEIEAVAILFTALRRDDVRSATGLPLTHMDALVSTFRQGDLIRRLARPELGALTLKQLEGDEFAPFVALLAETGFRDAALVPLFDRYEPMGALLALSRKPDGFDRDGLHFLQSVANILAAAVQRSRSEEQLAHAQRLDAVGQLTGGIAHDFNNLLTVISGNLQLLETELAERTESREIMDSALRAVDRGAALTRKLLAFARRQRLLPRPVPTGQLLSDLQEMLKRTLGERIAVTVENSDDQHVVFADPGELEAAIINLALNARDAMPRGGRLAISVRPQRIDEGDTDVELPPGSYVVFMVTDTGIGMAPDVLARALDPFFTTKEAGKGSGLGLSMVYGFVKQSGGHMAIDSQLGYGTRVELYLPAASPGAAHSQSSGEAHIRQGRETVLVVEDEPEVRVIALAFLRSLGYATYEASDAESALDLLARHADIEVLFSDVVLGSGMTGFDLVREARRLRPNLRALLTSGYERAPVGGDEAARSEFDVLRKPYRREQLAIALRKTLDREPNS